MDTDNEAEVKAKVAALFISDDATRRGIICGLVGHSLIVDDAGDGPTWSVTCARCAANRKNLTWQDTWEVQLGQTDGRI